MLTGARSQVDKEGGVGMEDAAGFFANVFGGERFRDYVSILFSSYLSPPPLANSTHCPLRMSRGDLGTDSYQESGHQTARDREPGTR